MVEEILRRLEKMKNRAEWETTWQEISDYILPRKGNITNRTKQVKRTQKLFDSTAIHANELLAASMQGTLTSASTTWFSLRMRDDEANLDKDIVTWLDTCAKRMYKAFGASNFTSESHEVYLDLGTIGTSCLLEEESETKVAGFNGLNFRAIHIGEYYIEENIHGYVDTVFRRFPLTARQAHQKWGDKIGERALQKLKTNPDEELEFVHAVFPAGDHKVGTKLPYASVYIEPGAKHVISVGGYHEFPYMVPRWTKVSGEKYGRSPSFTALPDVKTLNRATELELKAWAKSIDPPAISPDEGVQGHLKLIPSAVNYVRWDLVDKIRYLESGHKYDVSQLKMDELKQSIRNIFFADQFQLQDGPQMTATEVQVRYELMQRLLGPTMGRLESEFLNPLIARTFGIMYRAKAFPEAPDKLRGQDIDVEYVGPLARSQKLAQLSGITRLYETVGPIAEAKPEALDLIDEDEIVTVAAELLGVPPKIMRSEADVKRIRKLRSEVQEEEQMKEDIERASAAAGAANGKR